MTADTQVDQKEQFAKLWTESIKQHADTEMNRLRQSLKNLYKIEGLAGSLKVLGDIIETLDKISVNGKIDTIKLLREERRTTRPVLKESLSSVGDFLFRVQTTTDVPDFFTRGQVVLILNLTLLILLIYMLIYTTKNVKWSNYQ